MKRLDNSACRRLAVGVIAWGLAGTAATPLWAGNEPVPIPRAIPPNLPKLHSAAGYNERGNNYLNQGEFLSKELLGKCW